MSDSAAGSSNEQKTTPSTSSATKSAAFKLTPSKATFSFRKGVAFGTSFSSRGAKPQRCIADFVSSSDYDFKDTADISSTFRAELDLDPIASQSGQFSGVAAGKIIKGIIVDINRDFITVDIGFKSDGIIPSSQFTKSDGKLDAVIGDDIDVLVLQVENELGQIVLSKEKADQKRVWSMVEDAFKNDTTVSGTVVMKVKGGLQVDIGIPAFLPGSQIDLRPHKNLDKFLGQTFDFKVLKMTRDKGNIVLSRRALLISERESLRRETLKVLEEGVVIEGTVKNILEYGAFIDLGGIDGLLHVTDISWGRLNHPSEKISVGQTVQVVILKYDKDRERVSLGMKQLTQDPWAGIAERFPIGTKVSGKIASIVDYGAFVLLEEGIEGLIHVSEMSWTKKSRHPNKIVSDGQEVEAVVLGIDAEQQRISLGLRQLTPNPWDELKKEHPVGSTIKGKIRTVADFGIFIAVTEDIDGLVHVTDFSWLKRSADPQEIQAQFKKGDEVEAMVLEIDGANERLSLGLKQLQPNPWDTILQRYPVRSKIRGRIKSIADFGIFVEVEEGIEGLVHINHLNVEKGQDLSEAFVVGNEIECEVINVEPKEERISLSVTALQRRGDEGYADFSAPQDDSLTFGDLLQRKISERDS
jgi:small subunit ribosomal protein S1